MNVEKSKKKKIEMVDTYCFSLPKGTGKIWKMIRPNQTTDIDAKCNGLN